MAEQALSARIRETLRAFWRWMLRRCRVCGAKIGPGGDPRDLYWHSPSRRQCRACNKLAVHASNYGGARG